MARRVKWDHAKAYFRLLSRLKREGSFLLQNRLQAQSAELEQIIRFEVVFRWHTGMLTLAGVGFLLGVDVQETATAASRALQLMMAPPPVSIANSPAL